MGVSEEWIVIREILEEISKISGRRMKYDELISNRAIPCYLPMMKRLGYAFDGEKVFHLTNERHLDGLKKIQGTDAQISTFTVGGPELTRLPSQPNCLVTLEGTEVISGKSDIWTTVDVNGMRWINHNSPERTTKFKLTFAIDGILTRLLRDYGVDFDTNMQPREKVLVAIKKVKDKKKFYKDYFKKIEQWLDSGGYKEFNNYLNNAAEMKYNEVVLTDFKILVLNSIDVDNNFIKKFAEKNNIDYKGVFPSNGLSNLKI